jgi:hypothetical protein
VLYRLRKYIPELRDEDLVMEVNWNKLDPITGMLGREVFAKYKDGKIVLR